MVHNDEFMKNVRIAIRQANQRGFVGTAEALRELERTARLEAMSISRARPLERSPRLKEEPSQVPLAHS